MSKACKTIVLICYSIILSSYAALAQSDYQLYEVGLNVGTYIYQGDLTPATVGSFKTPSLAVSINGQRRINRLLAFRLDLSLGQLRGNDAAYAQPEWRRERNFRFRSTLTELIGSLVYYPLNTDHKITPYLFGGIGYSFVRIKRDYSNYNAAYFNEEGLSDELAQDIEHPLPRAIPIIPIGAGLRFPINQNLLLSSEAAYRYMSTDYLDGFSQAGNPQRKDHYYKFSVGIHYIFGGKDKYDCPVIRQ